MSFPVSWTEGVAVVTGPPEIDITNAGLLRAALLSAAENAPAVLVVDLTETEFCDSTGLNALVRAQMEAEQAGTELRLVVRAAAVHRMLAITGVAAMFRTFDRLADAVLPA
jgi:anti-sigma B factor antagonist